MLENVSISKRKMETIVTRVDEDIKKYVGDAASKLGVSVSAYILQLIENDRNGNCVVLHLDDDLKDKLCSLLSDGDSLSLQILELLKGSLYED